MLPEPIWSSLSQSGALPSAPWETLDAEAEPAEGYEEALEIGGVAPAVSRHELRRWISRYVRHAPPSLCLREINRMIAMRELWQERSPKNKILDVGCGDGFWWGELNPRCEVFGVDISRAEIERASTRITAEVCDVSRERPFAGHQFSDIVGNCSLEHVRDIYSALSNIRSAASPDARLVLFVPARDWAYQGMTQGFLLKHAPRAAMLLSGAMNGFFQHWHLYDMNVWKRLLEASGFNVIRSFGLGSPRSEMLFRLFLPEGLVEFLARTIVGQYPCRLLRHLPTQAMLPLERLLEWALSDPIVEVDAPTAYEYVIVASVRPASRAP
jgi:SAM-dependent methyltransferase